MPTYQYACTTCDHRFEAVQAFTDASLSECPQCSGVLRKVFSSVGIVFKGSGFYRTDSRAGAVPNGDAAAKANGTSSDSKSEKSTSSESSTGSAKKDSGSSTSSSGTLTPAAAKS